MTTSTVEVKLKIDINEDNVLASLSFVNKSDDVAYINKINGCLDGEIKNNVFTIETEGCPIKYTGVFTKRMRPGPDDVVALQIGEIINVKVKLNKAYAFLPGEHHYRAYYSAFHQFPDRPGFIDLESNVVTFTYGG